MTAVKKQEASPGLAYPTRPEYIPTGEVSSGQYVMRFARTPADLETIQRLRFEIFNIEMGEGLEESYKHQKDEDEFDLSCHHLLVLDAKCGQVVGTYRMQSHDMAARGRGFYSATEFDLSHLPGSFLDEAVELGRACIHVDHRNGRVLFLLWKGLIQYMRHNGKRFFFGCCSLTSQDPAEGRRMTLHLETQGHLHPSFRVFPQPGFECAEPGREVNGPEPIKVPKLMRLYLEYGVKICGAPAIDRLFKTIDYLAVFDIENNNERMRKMFLS